jgi:hypothetical protein
VLRDAVISEDGLYRYSLTRQWGESNVGPLFIMLNPSKADADVDDPTVRKCIGFAQRWGYDAMRVVNLFAFRATEPDELIGARDARGPLNAEVVRGEISIAAFRDVPIVAAWGGWWSARQRGPYWRGLPRINVERTVQDFGGRPLCLGVTNDGSPRHPCRLPYSTPLVPWP